MKMKATLWFKLHQEPDAQLKNRVAYQKTHSSSAP